MIDGARRGDVTENVPMVADCSYPGVADYQLYASSIASAFLWWNDNGQVAQDELVLVLGKLVLDPNVSIGSKLYIDQAAYDRGN